MPFVQHDASLEAYAEIAREKRRLYTAELAFPFERHGENPE